MTECYSVLCGLPLVGVALAGTLIFPAFMFFSSKSDRERLDWLAATAVASLMFVTLMFYYGG